jgi:hypothetical protein
MGSPKPALGVTEIRKKGVSHNAFLEVKINWKLY